MYMPINPLSYSCIKKLQRDILWHAYNEPTNFYSVFYDKHNMNIAVLIFANMNLNIKDKTYSLNRRRKIAPMALYILKKIVMIFI